MGELGRAVVDFTDVVVILIDVGTLLGFGIDVLILPLIKAVLQLDIEVEIKPEFAEKFL
ncbi:hypothetical protein [Microvirga ossetica]|uniref:hypothetical protein n=1 Tax=Microvirga ossetica TaxID=1882682 RepID=UPI0012FFF022|nr:hypothetical protein [Microvirga ossetica]